MKNLRNNLLNLKSLNKINKNFFTNKTRKIDPFGATEVIKTHPEPNPKRLIGKYAIITGSNGGVGSESLDLFAASGASGITITDLDEKKGNELAQKYNDLHKKNFVNFVKADISNEDQVKRLFIEHMQHHGKLNVLLNNAGVMLNDDTSPVDTSLEIWNKTMAINATSVFLCCKYGIPEIMKSRGPGSIINISSIVALVGSANAQIAYTASKGAVLAMTKEAAIVHARDNIRMNAICPGPLYTDLLKYLLDSDEKLDRRLVHLPYGRFGHAKEIAQAATFLASDESSLVNATEFVVDGGLTKAYLTPI